MNTAIYAPKEKWIENFARFGLAAKGITYIVIGIVSAIFAFNGSDKGIDKQGAVKEIWKQPYGHVILMILTLGFLGYVMWRWLQAFKDTEHKGADSKGIFRRFTYFMSGLIYAGLAVSCIKLLLGSSSNSSQRDSILNQLINHTAGQILLGACALFVIGFGIYQCYQGYSNKFRDEVNDLEVNDKVRKAYTIYGKIGYMSRGVVLILMGFFLGKAVVHSNPGEAEGSEGIMSFLYHIGGPVLMIVIALGVAGYGLFMLVKARYQTVKVQ